MKKAKKRDKKEKITSGARAQELRRATIQKKERKPSVQEKRSVKIRWKNLTESAC